MVKSRLLHGTWKLLESYTVHVIFSTVEGPRCGQQVRAEVRPSGTQQPGPLKMAPASFQGLVLPLCLPQSSPGPLLRCPGPPHPPRTTNTRSYHLCSQNLQSWHSRDKARCRGRHGPSTCAQSTPARCTRKARRGGAPSASPTPLAPASSSLRWQKGVRPSARLGLWGQSYPELRAEVSLAEGPSPRPRPGRDAHAGKSLAYCQPSWSVPPGTLKSTNQSETWGEVKSVRMGTPNPQASQKPGGREISVGRNPRPTPHHKRSWAHPCPLQGWGLRGGLGALMQPRGVTPHVPVCGQTPAAGWACDESPPWLDSLTAGLHPIPGRDQRKGLGSILGTRSSQVHSLTRGHGKKRTASGWGH